MSQKLLSAGVIAGMLAVASVVHGAVIASYNFSTSLTAASSVDPNASASSLTLGTSVNTPISSNDFYVSKPVITLSPRTIRPRKPISRRPSRLTPDLS